MIRDSFIEAMAEALYGHKGAIHGAEIDLSIFLEVFNLSEAQLLALSMGEHALSREST